MEASEKAQVSANKKAEDLEKKLASTSSDLEVVEGRCSTLSKDNETLQSQVSNLESSLSTQKANFDAEIATLRNAKEVSERLHDKAVQDRDEHKKVANEKAGKAGRLQTEMTTARKVVMQVSKERDEALAALSKERKAKADLEVHVRLSRSDRRARSRGTSNPLPLP